MWTPETFLGHITWWPWNCTAQISCSGERNWLTQDCFLQDTLVFHVQARLLLDSSQPATGHSGATHAGLFLQGVGLPWQVTLTLGLPINLVETSVTLCCSLRHSLPHTPSFFPLSCTGACTDCVSVWVSPCLLQLPLHFLYWKTLW